MNTDRVMDEILLHLIVLDEKCSPNEVSMERFADQGSESDFEVVSVKVFIYFTT